jgi:hypothetical protein
MDFFEFLGLVGYSFFFFVGDTTVKLGGSIVGALMLGGEDNGRRIISQ